MDSSNDNHPVFHGTTILSVRRQTPSGIQVAIGGDGQVTLGNIVVKGTARKVRKLYHGKVLAGFAGATADAFTLFERFEAQLQKHSGHLVRAAVELAKEWACAGLDDGFANRYTLTTDGLLFLDLSQPTYTILNWLAMLVENRRFQPTTAVAAQGIEYLKQVFLPDASQADVIVGYRADDSYFSFARAFVNNAISIDQLAEAMRLGELGKQIVLTSPRAFAALRFQGCEIARASTYHGLRNERDRTAREAYRRKSAEADLDGLFMRDIIREKVTNDDPRL